MRSIRLEPVRQKPVPPPNFESLPSLREFERAVRVHRANEERFEIKLAPSVEGPHAVQGETGAAYLVDLVDRTGAHDACTCPDFLTNEVGTCKHVEAMHRLLRGNGRLRGQLPAQVSKATLAVDANGPAKLVVVGAHARVGRALLEAHGTLNAAAAEEAVLRGIRVLQAARALASRLSLRTELARRGNRVRRAIEKSKGALDVLTKPLFPYQRDGVMHLVTRGRALLADDMGLGKTVQAIAACEQLRLRGEASRILIVTPASLKDQWAREIDAYAGQRATVVGGGAKSRKRTLREADAPYTILNYELAMKELELLNALEADVLVLDEAQRAKNFRTKTAATLRQIPSKFLFVLTGTPVENRLDDLYSLLQLVDPAILGPLWKFNFDFHRQNERGRVVGAKNLGELRKRTSSCVLRRRKDEVLHQLPAITYQTRHVKPLPSQVAFEASYRLDAYSLLSIAEKRPLSPEERERLMKALLKARQACNATALIDASDPEAESCPKLDELEALVAEICQQGAAKILVFSEWTGMLDLAAERLTRMGVGFGYLHGGVPTEKRPMLIEKFREDPDQRVLLSTDAGGVGLNLQAASYIIHLDLPWNPGRLDQRNGRAHRVGQTHGVMVTYLVSASGIERGIEGTLSSKRALRSAAIDATSDLDDVELQGFTRFLQDLRDMVDSVEGATAADDEAARANEAPPSDEEPIDESRELPADIDEPETLAEPASATQPAVETVAPAPAAAAPSKASLRALDRLRFGGLVIEAGYRHDAMQAAYDALACAIASLLAEPPIGGHAQLVGAIHRELLPQGRIAPAATIALAKLRDLTLLRESEIDVDEAIAREALREAGDWVERIVG